MKPIIKIENLSKQYRLGTIGTGTIGNDLKRWWYNFQGKEDPFLKIGDANDRSTKANSKYVWALHGISLEVMPGEVLGIIGKNGAGKSTLLKILSKVTGPTTGFIHFNGRIGSLLEVGTGFHPELTGRENIFLNGAILGMSKKEIKSKLDEIIDFSGCARYIDTPVKRYSSGMTVRLGFAVAAHLEPEILVVDEVLAVGDAEFQKKAIGKMHDVSRNDGRTVLFVSHNMVAIESLCTKGLLLNNGTTEMLGNVTDVKKRYLDYQIKLSETPLKHRKDREGNGAIRFTKIKLLNSDLEVIEKVHTGETFYIQIDYEKQESISNEAIHLSIAIYDNNGQQITDLSNQQVNQVLYNVNKQGYFLCKVNKLPVINGKYTFNLFCRVNNEISDWILNGGTIEVLQGDFYNTGRIVDSSQSKILLDYHWSNAQ